MGLFQGLPRQHFRFSLVDPPWPYEVRSPKGEDRGAVQHYECMTIPEIMALPVGDYAELDSWLGLWITGPLLVRGTHVDVMEAWGFTPSGIGWSWAKTTQDGKSWHMGLGHTTRHNIELCLLGRRGNAWRRSRSVRELIVAPVREHSRKPDIHPRIEQFTWGPYLELFGRQQRKGWTV